MSDVVKVATQHGAVDEDALIRVLQNSLYPGARPETIRLVLAWCRATGRDPMKKPIHVVPMWVKDAVTGQGAMRDTLMPGIGTYRTDAATTGEYAGKSEPEFGPTIKASVGGVVLSYPEWCRVTVRRLNKQTGQAYEYPAKEYWLENYATAKRDSDAPNAMWRKRPFAQLAKCAEAQALRMAFPDETGGTNTAEEMEGKTFAGPLIEAEADRAGGAQEAIANTAGVHANTEPERVIGRSDQEPEPEFVDQIEYAIEEERDGHKRVKLINAYAMRCETTDDLAHLKGLNVVRLTYDAAPPKVRSTIDAIWRDAAKRLVPPPDETGTEDAPAFDPG